MSIYKRGIKSGCKQRAGYAVAIDLPVGIDGRRRRRYVGAFKTKEAARLAEREALNERDHGIGIEPQKLTVDGLLQRYLSYRATRCTAGTIKRYDEIRRLYIAKHLGTTGVKDLSSLAIDELYARLAKQLSPQSVFHVHRLFKGTFRYAVKKKLLLRSPFEDVEAPVVPKREARALTPDEARRLLAAVEGTRAYAWFLFALLSGARQGEIAALSWSDIDLSRKRVTIRSSFSERFGKPVLKCTKSGKPRTFALSPRCLELLRSQRAAIASERLHAPPGIYSTEHNLVFPDPTGRPTRLHAFRDAFIRAARTAGICDASFHTLRHSAATWMLGKGANIHSVQAVLGHSVASTTINIYGHVIAELQDRAVAMLDATLETGFAEATSA